MVEQPTADRQVSGSNPEFCFSFLFVLVAIRIATVRGEREEVAERVVCV